MLIYLLGFEQHQAQIEEIPDALGFETLTRRGVNGRG
jgi:hypothetical protein